MERLEFITSNEYLRVLMFFYAELECLQKNLENENTKAVSAVASARKELIREMKAVRADPRREDVDYGWRVSLLDLVVKLSNKLEECDNPYASLLLTNSYHSANKLVIEMATNNTLLEISSKAHRDYLKSRRGGIS